MGSTASRGVGRSKFSQLWGRHAATDEFWDPDEDGFDYLQSLAGACTVPELIKALRDPDTDVRWRAARALGRKKLSSAAIALPQLILALKDENWQVQESAAETLGLMGLAAAQAVPQLSMALQDRVEDVRRTALQALGRMGPEAAGAVPHLIEALDDQQWQVRKDTAQILGRMGPAAAGSIPSAEGPQVASKQQMPWAEWVLQQQQPYRS